jgi:hypothetical protein
MHFPALMSNFGALAAVKILLDWLQRVLSVR